MQLAGVNQLPSSSLPQAIFRETAYYSQEKLDVSYRDESGRAFNLSIEREVSYYSATYDRTGSLGKRGAGEQRAAGELEDAPKDLRQAVRGFRRRLHRQLMEADQGYRRWAEKTQPRHFAAQSREEVTVSAQSLKISMDVVDPEYWSVENTAGRLRDFALSLYGGGDRQAHADKMIRAMEVGYRQAEKAFGGTLPAISRQTVDAARQMILDWAAGTAPEAAPAAQGLDLAA